MKNPAASSGVSEEGEMAVLMELLINPSLLLDMDILAHPIILRPKGRGINPGLYLSILRALRGDQNKLKVTHYPHRSVKND
jgi:hypothetical protein